MAVPGSSRSILTFGLLGAGRWGSVYVRTLRGVEHARLGDVAALHPSPDGLDVVPDWRAVVEGPCDAVIIAAPDRLHPEMLRACLAARKPCIVEKPLSLDLETTRQLDAEVRASGVPVLVNHVHLFAPAWSVLRDDIAREGEAVRCVVSDGGALGPFRADSPALWDWAPHDFSLLYDLVRQRPETIRAVGIPRARPEHVSIALSFGDTEALVVAGRLASRKRRTFTVFTSHHMWVWDDVRTPTLTKARIDFDARDAGGLPRDVDERPLDVPGVAPMRAMLDYFVAGINGGPTDRFGTALALEIAHWLHSAGESAR